MQIFQDGSVSSALTYLPYQNVHVHGSAAVPKPPILLDMAFLSIDLQCHLCSTNVYPFMEEMWLSLLIQVRYPFFKKISTTETR